MRGSSEVVIPSSKIKKSIAEILKDEGFIEDWEVSSDEDSFPEIKLQLKYLNDGQPVIRKIKRESKPGLRVYLKSNDAKPVLSGQGSPSLRHLKVLCLTGSAAKKKSVEKYFVPFGKELID